MDESMRAAGDDIEGAVYILAATVADPAECDTIREALRDLKLGNGPKLHWKDENDDRRALIGAAVAEMPVMHTVVVGTPLDQRKQERARRKCMERLFYELHTLG
ncbi:hypothetical protein [Microbacterium wangruii]|uniref:hypothetical protein n=1 Tax=Microbacterium wangruii TaxID=3049073 RepID=UPI00256F3CD9|nr:hypothetical protein [Microbacterium sp. zg-Y1211]MDL5487464.1 hypothetical protein [Microbacterium sp. zg-Y1211]